MTKKLAIQGQKWREMVSKVSELCNGFYALANTERFLEYSLVVLFWKYVSDYWREEVKHYLDSATSREKRLNLAASRFYVLPGASFYDVVEHCGESELGSYINQALEKLSVANSDSLKGIFKSFDFTSEDDIGPKDQQTSILSTLLESLKDSSLDLRPSNVADVDLGEMNILLLSLFFSQFGRRSNESYTNDDIATLMAKLSRPREGDSVFDPVCGTGSLLIRTSQEVDSGKCRLYGFEKSRMTHAIARINILFHNLDDANVQVGDSMSMFFQEQQNQFKQFERIVASPPFDGFHFGLAATAYITPFAGIDERPLGTIGNGANGYLKFLDLLIRMAKPRVGRVVVTVPAGILFRGKEEWLFRKRLIRENLLDAVISLPDGKVHGGSSTAILVIDRSREKGGENYGRGTIMFIDGKEKFNLYYKKNLSDFSHVEEIISGYETRASQPEFTYKASLDVIVRNIFDLTASRYIQQAQNERKAMIKKNSDKVKQYKMEITKLDEEIAENMKRLRIRQLDK